MRVNLQDTFLGALKRDGQVVSVFLQRGVQLKGVVKCFDQFTIFLEDSEGRICLVFKHAVTTISPSRPISGDFIAEAFGCRYNDEPTAEQE